MQMPHCVSASFSEHNRNIPCIQEQENRECPGEQGHTNSQPEPSGMVGWKNSRDASRRYDENDAKHR
jgi:hypothetical protein